MAQLRGLLTKIRHHHVLYDDFGLRAIDPTGGRTAINRYGPPGTGKSLAAKAQEAGAVLFFDEADSILGRHLSHDGPRPGRLRRCPLLTIRERVVC